eukprot:GFYU01031619.1.p1 GENE.GFYU01031619.1~~GFYU01031619.1.p1  ORF type:complete len:403 (-),score=103.76 GFYU01031619.1:325-1533(-)
MFGGARRKSSIRTCVIEGCDKARMVEGYCEYHGKLYDKLSTASSGIKSQLVKEASQKLLCADDTPRGSTASERDYGSESVMKGVMTLPPLEDGVLWHGWLMKSPMKYKTAFSGSAFKRRFFRLRHDELVYSKESKGKESGKVPLSGASIEAFWSIKDNSAQKKLWFEIHEPHSNRTVVLAATDDKDRQEWLKAFADATTEHAIRTYNFAKPSFKLINENDPVPAVSLDLGGAKTCYVARNHLLFGCNFPGAEMLRVKTPDDPFVMDVINNPDTPNGNELVLTCGHPGRILTVNVLGAASSCIIAQANCLLFVPESALVSFKYKKADTTFVRVSRAFDVLVKGCGSIIEEELDDGKTVYFRDIAAVVATEVTVKVLFDASTNIAALEGPGKVYIQTSIPAQRV